MWGPYTQSNIYKVEMVQRRAIRRTLNNFSPYDSVSQMQLRLGWRSLDQRRAAARLCMLYKIIQSSSRFITPYFQKPARMTRHRFRCHKSITVAHCAKFILGILFYKYSFYPLVFVQWNRLSSDVVLLPTLAQFNEAVRSLDHQLL